MWVHELVKSGKRETSHGLEKQVGGGEVERRQSLGDATKQSALHTTTENVLEASRHLTPKGRERLEICGLGLLS